MKRFAGKVVIFTGSSSGIGQTAALSFAEEGASVLIHGQNKERLEKTEKLLLAEGIPPTRIAKVLGSMEDPKTAELIVAECMRKFGRIDVLINNAGAFSKPGTADPDRMDNLDFLYNVNMRSVVQLTQLAMPHLERAKGNVISVSSCLALRQAMDAYFYGMLKAAMDHWTRGMAQKWGPRGVRFNCINPGPVDTPIFERNGLGGDLKKMHERWVEKTTPLGRYGQTSEMAGPLKFLASDEAAYITGACMSVDGGWAIASVGMDQV